MWAAWITKGEWNVSRVKWAADIIQIFSQDLPNEWSGCARKWSVTHSFDLARQLKHLRNHPHGFPFQYVNEGFFFRRGGVLQWHAGLLSVCTSEHFPILCPEICFTNKMSSLKNIWSHINWTGWCLGIIKPISKTDSSEVFSLLNNKIFWLPSVLFFFSRLLSLKHWILLSVCFSIVFPSFFLQVVIMLNLIMII